MDIKERKDVSASDCWDLGVLYVDSDAWNADFEKLKAMLPRIDSFRGTLGTSKEKLKAALDFSTEWEMLAEKLGEYAHLKTAEDVADSSSNERMGRYIALATQAAGAMAFYTPEIQAIDDERWAEWLKDPIFRDDAIALKKIRRYKPYVLSQDAERVLALGSESRSAIGKTFSSLTNADLEFGTVELDGKPTPLTQSTYTVFLQSEDENVRRTAYEQFYGVYRRHENTLASLYAGSVQQDVYYARARGYASARAKALFADDVPESVYDNLIRTVHDHLPTLHRYYDLRRKALRKTSLHHSDVYAPLVPGVEVRHTYDEAVDVVVRAVRPLGDEYVETLEKGLKGGWVDRYENKGKRSGAFSSGSYFSYPYILLNFKENNLRDVFTLAHEAGHSMHSWYSVRSNPYQHYGYTIFEAEVASTFNEQLLAELFLKESTSNAQKASLLSKLVEDTVATLFRQTMFAEFEHQVHAHAEAGNGLTLDYFRSTYRALLERYFGPNVQLEEYSALEGLRIPHFYNAFYVYKYATGLSAAIALSDLVLNGGERERTRYLSFLKSGGSKFPLESLASAGVDMGKPEPIVRAIGVFRQRLDALEKLLSV